VEIFAKIEENFENMKDDQELIIYDFSGKQIYFEKIVKPMLKDVGTFVFVFDCTNRKSFESIKMWVEAVRKEKAGNGFSGVLVSNKTDYSKTEVKDEEANDMARSLGFKLVRASIAHPEKAIELFRSFVN